MAEHTPITSRRRLLAAAPAALVLTGATAGAVQAAAPETRPSFYSTLDPEQKAAFDKLRAIVEAQANGTWVEPPNPDARLLTLCAEFYRQHAIAYRDHAEDDEGDGAEWQIALHARWELEDQIEDAPPLTRVGHLAKVSVAVTMIEEMQGKNELDGLTGFALATLLDVRDWLAGVVPA